MPRGTRKRADVVYLSPVAMERVGGRIIEIRLLRWYVRSDIDDARDGRGIDRGHRLFDDRLWLTVEEVIELRLMEPVTVGSHEYVAEGVDTCVGESCFQHVRHSHIAV